MIISRTPFRVSFAGGGTDIYDYYKNGYGAVVSTTINKYLYITVNKRFDDDIRVSYSKTEIVGNVDDLQHELCKECLKTVGINSGIEITSISDIPSGTGMGSSSVYVVGLINALYAYIGEQKSSKELAEIACNIEINKLGHPIGKQDQYSCAFGGLNYFRFNADESVDCEKIKLSFSNLEYMNHKLMLFYTGIDRNANEILIEQKIKSNNKIGTLDEIRLLANNLKDDLKINGFSDNFATTLHEGWQIKRSITNRISNDYIDSLYNKALSAGAKGGKLLGAGGGGFILLYCDDVYQDDVRKALELKEISLGLTECGSKIVYFGD